MVELEEKQTENQEQSLQHCLYINLKSRTDKKIHVENQLLSTNIFSSSFPPQRFEAIKSKNGAIGCSLSHIKCIQIAKENNWKYVMIVEDDITFLDPIKFKTQLLKFLTSHPIFDVLLLGGNNIPPYKIIDETCVKVSRCQTTTGYLVQQHYYDKLMENFKEGVRNLMNYPDKQPQYAIDKFWFKLQQKDRWFLLTPLSVIQNPGYSDIEEKMTDYSGMMMDLDKKTFFENIEKMRNRFKNSIYRV